MKNSLVSTWRGIALRGLFSILLGLAAFLSRDLTPAMLALGFGVYALIDGALTVLVGTRLQSGDRSWLMEGISSVTIGAIAILWFGLPLLPLLDLITFWALATGLLEVSAAIRWRRRAPGGDVSLGLAGFASLLLGAVTLSWPSLDVGVLVIRLGGYATFFGVCMLVLALQLRRSTRSLDSLHAKYLANHSQ